MKKIIHDALVLMAFSLALGFILGGVYQLTKPAIEKANREKEMQAYKEVFADAATFEEQEVDAAAAAELMTQNQCPDEINKAFKALDASGNTLGYVIQLTTKDGFSGGIVMVVGVRLDKTINGFSVTYHQETSGLGTKAFDPSYAGQFENISADEAQAITTISGATKTSTAVKNAIKAAVAYAESIW